MTPFKITERREPGEIGTIRRTTTDIEEPSYEINFELQCDLKKAFEKFSPIEQRVLIRVLSQGQSIEEATKRMRHSAKKWRNWFYNVALPQLRSDLADYRERMESGKEKIVA